MKLSPMKGFALLPILIAVAIVIAAGGAYLFLRNSPSAGNGKNIQTSLPKKTSASPATSSETYALAPRTSTPTVSRPAPSKSPTSPPSASAANSKNSSPSSEPAVVKSQVETWQPGTQWLDIPGPNGTTIKTAVTWPNGKGPFPVIILLHGSEGFRQTYVAIAQEFAKSGYVTAAPCWFTGFKAPLAHFSDYIDCPNGPPFNGANLQAVKNIDAVISYVENLGGVQRGKIGLIGSSRGSTMALLAASTENDIQAVVSVSAIYEYAKNGINDDLPITFVKNMNTPVLVLHGTNDSIVNIQEAYDYAAQLKNFGKTYQNYYYQNAPHQILYTDPYAGDVQTRATTFFSAYLK